MEYGSGKYTYSLVEGWAKLPEGESLVDVVGLSIDKDDRVYAFGRSKRPLIVFDRNGNEARASRKSSKWMRQTLMPLT